MAESEIRGSERIRLNLKTRTFEEKELNRLIDFFAEKGIGLEYVFPIGKPLSDLVSPLIIEADGTVVPVQHGFSRKYALGNLQQAPLRELAARWKQERYQPFRDLCRRVFEGITTADGLPLTNWYDAITCSSQQ